MMSFELINLTLPMVLQEIEDVLEEYPEHPYQSAFSIHEFRQQLIAHILSQISHCCETSGGQILPKNVSRRHPSHLAQRLYLGVMIRGSILHILRENADRLSDLLLHVKHSEPVAFHSSRQVA